MENWVMQKKKKKRGKLLLLRYIILKSFMKIHNLFNDYAKITSVVNFKPTQEDNVLRA